VEQKFLEAMTAEEREILADARAEAEGVAERILEDLADSIDSLEPSYAANASIVDEETRVKTDTSLARAYAAAEDEDASLREFLKEQKDRVRFSVQVQEQGYTATVRATLDQLQSRGYRTAGYKNFWSGRGRHSGLNVSMVDPTGFPVEVQFPTPLSRSVGKKTHFYYEVIRVPQLPFALRVDAFLSILAINKTRDIAHHLPADVQTLVPDVADTSFARWLDGKTKATAGYASWLAERGLTFRDILARHGLDLDDLTGGDGTEISHGLSGGLRVQRSAEVGPVRTGVEHPGLPEPGGFAAASGDVERSPQGMDLRTGDRGDVPVRRRVLGTDARNRSPDGRGHSAQRPEDRTSERGNPSTDERGGRADGLDRRSSSRVTTFAPADAGDIREELHGLSPASSSESVSDTEAPGSPPPGSDQKGPPSPLGGAPGPNSVDPATLATAQRDVLEQVSPHSRSLANVVVRLLDDHALNGNRLNLTTGLLDPNRRPRLIEILNELADNRLMASYATYDEFQAEHPGEGSLFDPVSDEVNLDADRQSRLKAFVDELKAADPARAVGREPTTGQMILIDDYAVALEERVLPAAEVEIRSIVDAAGAASALVTGRAKVTEGLLLKVDRMIGGNMRVPPRPHYRVGDVIDAVGTRVTVPDMRTLASVVERVKAHFGVGDAGRILEIENMYASPKAAKPLYRVISMVIAIEVDGKPYTFELQLCTDRASVSADLEHNTLFKPYVPVSARESRTVTSLMEEAAAMDQLETVRDV